MYSQHFHVSVTSTSHKKVENGKSHTRLASKSIERRLQHPVGLCPLVTVVSSCVLNLTEHSKAFRVKA